MGSKVDFLDSYNTVAERIAEFGAKHPEGCLQQVSVDFRQVNDRWWVVYTAAAYRTPDDVRPGIGTSWEPIPGTTPYTRDSEVQNAETAAWGRAIVAVLGAETKKGVASFEEVRNRQEATHDPWAGKSTVVSEVAPAYITKASIDELTLSSPPYVPASVVERYQKELKVAVSLDQVEAIRKVALNAGVFAPAHGEELKRSIADAKERLAVVVRGELGGLKQSIAEAVK